MTIFKCVLPTPFLALMPTLSPTSFMSRANQSQKLKSQSKLCLLVNRVVKKIQKIRSLMGCYSQPIFFSGEPIAYDPPSPFEFWETNYQDLSEGAYMSFDGMYFYEVFSPMFPRPPSS